MTPHRIRLAGFWETVTAGVMTRHSRRFGKPRSQDVTETVWIVSTVAGEIEINGVALGSGASFDITAHLLPRNELAIVLPPDVPLGEVVLEIRPAGPHSS